MNIKITKDEFKKNTDKYFKEIKNNEIEICEGDKEIAFLVSASKYTILILESLVGIVKDLELKTLDEIRNERLSRQLK